MHKEKELSTVFIFNCITIGGLLSQKYLTRREGHQAEETFLMSLIHRFSCTFQPARKSVFFVFCIHVFQLTSLSARSKRYPFITSKVLPRCDLAS